MTQPIAVRVRTTSEDVNKVTIHSAHAGDRRVVLHLGEDIENLIDMRPADAQRLAIALLNAALEMGL